MNSCSVANRSATSLVAASVIVRSLLDGEDVGFDLRAGDADWRCSLDLNDASGSCLSVVAAPDILLHEVLGLGLDREAVADFGIEVGVRYVLRGLAHRLLCFFDIGLVVIEP